MSVAAPPRVAVKAVALPNEHGAWAFLLEPAVLGLLLAPSWPGLLVVLAATGALLAQHPLSLALADRRRGRTYPRTRLAWRLAGAYGAVALAFLLLTVVWLGDVRFLAPAALAAPLAAVQLGFDARNRGRRLLPELAGATAMGALVACVLVVGGWSLVPALSMWLLSSLRAIPSILYVRTRLGIERGRPGRRLPAVAAQILALAVGGYLLWMDVAPILALAALAVLTARALVGLSALRRPVKAKVIGMREIAFGALFVLATAAGAAGLP